MTDDQKKHLTGAAGQPHRAERAGGRRIFRLDSSAYTHRSPNDQAEQLPYDEPDDLIAPSIASSFTTELSFLQIPESFRAYFDDAQNADRSDFVRDWGGQAAPSTEASPLDHNAAQADETLADAYLDLEDMLPPSQVGLDSSLFPAQSAPSSPDKFFAPAPPVSSARTAAEQKPRRRTPPAWVKRLFPTRFIAFLLLAVTLFAPLALFSGALRLVHLTVDGQPVGYLITRADKAEVILHNAGYSPGPADHYALTQCGLETRLEFQRAARVMLYCDGQQQTFYALQQTVEQALVSLDIELGDDDECNLPLDYILNDRDELVVYRVRYEESRRTEILPWQEILKPSPLIATGATMVMNPGGGRDGAALRLYRDKYVNGELWDSVIQNEQVTSFPRNVVTLQGQADAIMSTVDGGDFTDIQIVDNAPTSYQKLLSTQPCTAYSFAPGCYGASGMFLFQGFVAVNSAVIPLGSLLYITSPNGRFVYGWAIAADVGTAMMDGRVTIDCFFETYRESVLFGRRTMNVYVVRQLTQAELEPYIASEGMFRNRIPAQ